MRCLHAARAPYINDKMTEILQFSHLLQRKIFNNNKVFVGWCILSSCAKISVYYALLDFRH
jgi:hypothetical protein